MTPSTPNMFIKHKQYRDICWRVLTEYSGTGYVKYKAECWNMGYKASWSMGIKDYLEIKLEDISNWIFTTDLVPCLRNAQWTNLDEKTKP